jgi:hypothetical protein
MTACPPTSNFFFCSSINGNLLRFLTNNIQGTTFDKIGLFPFASLKFHKGLEKILAKGFRIWYYTSCGLTAIAYAKEVKQQ